MILTTYTIIVATLLSLPKGGDTFHLQPITSKLGRTLSSLSSGAPIIGDLEAPPEATGGGGRSSGQSDDISQEEWNQLPDAPGMYQQQR